MKPVKFLMLILILFSFVLNVQCQANPDKIIVMKPYLQAVTTKSVVVMAESSSKNTIYVQYGTDSLFDKTAQTWYFEKTTEGTFVHRIKLEKLSPDTEYNYRINSQNEVFAGHFYTAKETPGPFRFTVIGDTRSNPKVSGKISELAAGHQSRFSLYTGDLCYDEDYDSWKEEFFTEGQLNLAANVPFFNAVGNHEDWEQNTIAFTQAPVDHTLNAAYYSFDYGDAHFLIISSEHDLDDSSEQYQFIKDDLAKTDKKWKIAAVHVPAYCAGGHDENRTMKRITRELLEPAGVDILFAGHSHFYQHNKVNNIHHLVVAGGGAPLYSPDEEDYVIKSAKKHHYAVIDVFDDNIRISVYSITGELIDNFELTKW